MPADILVSGAGTAGANGTYVYDSDYGGKPKYVKDACVIRWYAGIAWQITNPTDNDVYYVAFQDVATPDLVATWSVAAQGDSPAPTVTEYTPDYTLSCDPGSLTLSGTAASLLYNRIFSCDAGTLVLSGTSASLQYRRIFACEAGAITLAGTSAGLLHNRLLSCDSGSLTLSGTDTNFLYNRIFSCDAGTLALTGTDADLLYNKVLSCDGGALVLIGTDAVLVYFPATPSCRTFTIPAENRTFAISGVTSEDTAGNLQYWGGLYFPVNYWGLSYWGAYWAIPTERAFTIPQESRTFTIECEE
jgi:hypothetical protein